MRALVARMGPVAALAFALLASAWGTLYAHTLASDNALPDTTTATFRPAESGWNHELAAGYIGWGERSQRGSGSLLAETALGYMTTKGFGYGLALSLSATEVLGVGTLARFGYNAHYGRRSGYPIALLAFGGPKAAVRSPGVFDDYSGWQYGAEAQLRPRVGARRHAQAFFAIGFHTVRERYRANFSLAERKVTHSGLRLRVGVVW